MRQKELAYKHGIWEFGENDEVKFSKDRWMISVVERLKYDVENNDPSDKKAQKHINDLLYHYCWKVADSEGN